MARKVKARINVSNPTWYSVFVFLGTASSPVLWLRDPAYGEAQSRPHDPPLKSGSQVRRAVHTLSVLGLNDKALIQAAAD